MTEQENFVTSSRFLFKKEKKGSDLKTEKGQEINTLESSITAFDVCVNSVVKIHVRLV